MPDAAAGQAPSHILRQSGLRPRKGLGQNFLQDGRVARRIVEGLGIVGDEVVVEVGPGTGVLTSSLVDSGAKIVAIELDANLASLLKERYPEDRLTVVHADVLAVDPCELVPGGYKLVGNIPYYITGSIIRHFLESPCPPLVMVFMVQREVAERMVAGPGSMSLLSVSVQLYARAEIIARVPAGAFYPRPKVDSAVVRLVPQPPPLPRSLIDTFFRVARAGFGMKRKQLANSLSHRLSISRTDVGALLAQAGIDPSRRAETLTVDDWVRVTRAYASLPAGEPA